MEIRTVSIDSINPAPYNPRKDLQPGDPEYEQLKRSIQEFGYVDPCIWNERTGNLVGGHQRLKILIEDGNKEVDVSVVNLDETREKALNVALNKISGEWDHEKLMVLLQELTVSDVDVALTGFSEADIDALVSECAPSPEVQEDDFDTEAVAESIEDPVTRSGDIWLLGNHRLMCGDSTKAADVQRLLAGERADLVWTDPPYGVSYVGKTQQALTIENDDLDVDALERFLTAALANAKEGSRPGAVWYIASPGGPQLLAFAKTLTTLGIWRQAITWVKDTFVLGHSDFHYRHEVLFYGWVPGGEHMPPPDRKQDSVWEIPRPKRSKDHPTMKPIELPARSMCLSSRPRDRVLDLFSGSGTTLIAAEQLGRVCYAMELDPRYCDVIIRRWQEQTGKRAVREDGPSYEELLSARDCGGGS